MLSDSFKKRARSKKTALAVAFGVVAGGIAVATVPVLAPAYAAGGASVSLGESSIAPSGQIDISGTGFDAGAYVYVQIAFPDGNENLSWNSTPLVATSEGNVAVSLVNPEPWAAGEYTITLTQNEEKSAQTSLRVVAETPEPTETETTAPTETGTPEPTSTETTTPAPTETSTPEPTSTATTAPEPTETETTAPKPTETETPEPTETTAPQPTNTESPTPEPTSTETPAPSGPAASAEHATLTPEEAKANGVSYVLTGFPPNTPVELTLTLPDGTNAVFGSGTESIVTDADGNYAGKITYSGDWPIGDYAATVEAKVVQTEANAASAARAAVADAPAPTTSSAIATFTFRIATDGSLPGTGGNGAVDHGGTGSGSGDSGKGTASNTGTGSSATGSGKGSSNASGGLATTGAEDLFGAAGIGLLVLAGGVGVYAGARFINRRRKAQ